MKARFISITVAPGVEEVIKEALKDQFFNGYFHLSFVEFKAGDGYSVVTLKTTDKGLNVAQVFFILGRHTHIKESLL